MKTSISILEFTKYFLTSSALQNLVSPNLCVLLRLSRILNIFNVSFSSSLNTLNALSPYQKLVYKSAMHRTWVMALLVEINTAPHHN